MARLDQRRFVDGDLLQRSGIQRLAEVRRLEIHHGRLLDNLDGGRGRADREARQKTGNLADLNNHVIA